MVHIKERWAERVKNDFVAFCGDGMADLCTVLRLSEADLAFLRKGFKLDTALRDKGLSMLRPEVISWTTGGHIIEKLRESLSALISKSSWVKNL